MADSLSHLQHPGLYVKSPPDKPDEGHGITIFDEGETIHEHAQPEDFTPSNPDTVTLVTDSNNEESVSDQHTFQVGDYIYHIQYIPIRLSIFR